jgi:hypothetical protein
VDCYRRVWMRNGHGQLPRSPDGCTPRSQTIRSIQIGITEQQVTDILGQPLQIRPWGDDVALWDYAIPGGLYSNASLWISFDKGRVRAVQGKRHPLIAEDYAVYGIRSDQLFESPDFEATFTRAR